MRGISLRQFLLALWLLIASPAMAAEQFDLICKGDDEVWRYRIDLARGEWCARECDVTLKIVSTTASTIVLQQQEPQFRGGDSFRNMINRATGEWYFYRSLPSIDFSKTVDGKCVPAPFSGFPAAKF